MLDQSALLKTMKLHAAFAKIVGVTPESRAVIINGKLVGPLREEEDFTAGDFNLLEKYSMNLYGNKLRDLVPDSESAMKASSMLQKCAQSKVRHDIKYATDSHAVINAPPKVSRPSRLLSSTVKFTYDAQNSFALTNIRSDHPRTRKERLMIF